MFWGQYLKVCLLALLVQGFDLFLNAVCNSDQNYLDLKKAVEWTISLFCQDIDDFWSEKFSKLCIKYNVKMVGVFKILEKYNLRERWKQVSEILERWKQVFRNLREIFPKSSFQNLREIVISERWKQIPEILERWKQVPEIACNITHDYYSL